MHDIWAIILAAGSSTRLASATGGTRKQYLCLAGEPLYFASARTFAAMPDVRGLVAVFPPEEADERGREFMELARGAGFGVPVRAAAGGERRQDSVRSALAALPDSCEGVLVHDGARPFFSAALAARVVDALRAGAAGAVPAVPVADTIKQVRPLAGNDRAEGPAEAEVTATLVRSELAAVQTPQGFALPLLREAHERAEAGGWDVTDDASMVERLATVVTVAGEMRNRKITTPEDLEMIVRQGREIPVTGWGYDVHRFGGERPLVLGGVPIPGGVRVVAHSDGDVLLHALADAILGTFGGGDIGRHFPDTDPRFSGVESGVLVKEAQLMAEEAGVRIVHADLTVIAQTPKIAPHREAIAASVAMLLGLGPGRVNVKATTEEGLGFTGEKLGIKSVACVSALRTVRE